MVSIIKSVSLNKIEVEFLEDYELSPTSLLKEKIWEMKGAIKKLVSDKIHRMAAVIEKQAERIEQMEDVLEKEREYPVE